METRPVKYIVYGKPQQQERARAVAKYGKVKLYDPVKSRNYKKKIKNVLRRHNPTPLDGPIKMTFDIYMPIPKSYSQKRRQAILEGKEFPAKKPDLSNYIKIIEDACNGILYTDDSKIVEIIARKHYGERPRIEFEIEEKKE